MGCPWTLNLTILTQVSLLMKDRFINKDMGSQVPSSTHVCKSQQGGKVPTFEPRETIGRWFYIHWSRISVIIYDNIFVGLVLFARPSSQHKSRASLMKGVVMVSYLGLGIPCEPTPCSQRLRLYESNWNDFGLGIRVNRPNSFHKRTCRNLKDEVGCVILFAKHTQLNISTVTIPIKCVLRFKVRQYYNYLMIPCYILSSALIYLSIMKLSFNSTWVW
jgi:hypothetical protein